MKKSNYLLTILIILIIIAIIISPQKYIAVFSNGMMVWATILLPTIFPLIFFTKILTDLGVINTLANKFKFTTKLFNTPPISLYAFFISIMSGYPVGAKVLSDLYERNLVTKNEAYRICTFTSNSGPMFIYGSVGISMLFSRKLGLILLFSHIISAILNGILYRKYKSKSQVLLFENKSIKNTSTLGENMADSVISILIIGGFVCIFFVIIEIINDLKLFLFLATWLGNIFNVDFNIFLGIFNGFLEITHGCLDITSISSLSPFYSALICCGIITFGGIATMFQAYAFLQKIGIKIKFFILQKITHTIFSVFICFILLLIFL